nr:MAG TPA: hypothetical protein [Caudoviricetes sp.]
MSTIKSSNYTFTIKNSVPEVGDLIHQIGVVTEVKELSQNEVGYFTDSQWRDMDERNISYDFYRIEYVIQDEFGNDYDEDYIAIERQA